MLTQNEIAAKRAERTMASRAKSKAKAKRYGLRAQLTARNREKTAAWLRSMGAEQQKAKLAADERHRQALESRRTQGAMPQHPKKGMIGRIKSFFGRGS